MNEGAVNKTVIVIAGPTAVGKTAVALEVAKALNTSILSADSRQCYKELNIGVARPSEKELQEVKHYFIASHSIQEEVNAAVYESYALEQAAQVLAQHDTVVLTGGTGLYIKAFCEGLDAIPPVSEKIRQEIRLQYDREGLPWLQQQVMQADPSFFEAGENQNPHRLMRALEVLRETGQSILNFRKGKGSSRPFRILKVALELPREDLYERINHRVELMVKAGLEEEARGLMAEQHRTALQTVGYQEWFDYFQGKATREETIERISRHTRHYAKRQLTWFRKDTAYAWMKPEAGKVLSFVREALLSGQAEEK